MVKIVGVKFNNSCKVYYFDPQGEDYAEGEGVIVDTARGTEYGVVMVTPRSVEESEVVQPLKPITRRATKKDIQRMEEYEKKLPSIFETAKQEVEKSITVVSDIPPIFIISAKPEIDVSGVFNS